MASRCSAGSLGQSGGSSLRVERASGSDEPGGAFWAAAALVAAAALLRTGRR